MAVHWNKKLQDELEEAYFSQNKSNLMLEENDVDFKKKTILFSVNTTSVAKVIWLHTIGMEMASKHRVKVSFAIYLHKTYDGRVGII